jgi:hypothetical protein
MPRIQLNGDVFYVLKIAHRKILLDNMLAAVRDVFDYFEKQDKMDWSIVQLHAIDISKPKWTAQEISNNTIALEMLRNHQLWKDGK